ncbi:MAG: HAD family hydrolase [Xenococcaceae cyanobacterium MO_188.B32]|nr:HAD family hydrolase [Xenococcaceae cyanobacterium MO_188.B32]
MLITQPHILALDFDGVICDGLFEYFATTQKTYTKIWNQDARENLDTLATSFYCLRPVIETGWEMPVLLRALVLGISEEKILERWSEVARDLVKTEQLDTKEIAKTLDNVRDEWINADLDSWLALHRFFPGILEQLAQIINSSTQLYIVTTKEGRFVSKLLHQQGIELPRASIIGKESQRPKYETLRLLRDSAVRDNPVIWFVEDRLKTLKIVQQQPDLSTVQLFLADWGYNTAKDRNAIADHPRIKLLSLAQFTQDFSNWVDFS